MSGRQGRPIGYARASICAPTLTEQIAALRAAGCLDDNIWAEPEGSQFDQLELALLDARKGDVFVVSQLICLSNSFKRLGRVLTELRSRDIQLWILGAPIDTRKGNVLPALLRLLKKKRDIKSEETRAGLAAARAAGHLGGRPEALPAEGVAVARELLADPRYTVAAVAEKLGVSRSTLYKKGLKRRPSKK